MAVNESFEALADPSRRAILEYLQEGSLSAGEIASRLPIGKPAVSHHLNKLKAAGLVSSERDGQSIIYSLNTTVFQDLMRWFYGFKGIKGDKK